MELSPHRLSLLLAVHRAGGIVAAADSQRMSPSAVSQQIRLLEKEAGVRVLDRTPAGSVLTDAGRVLAEAAERIEDELAAARRELAEMDDSLPTGRVRVGSFATAIRALLLPAAASTATTHPGLHLTIEETEERAGAARLRRGELDLLLLERDAYTLASPPRATAEVPLLDEAWLVVVPPGQPQPASLPDLARASWINLDPGTAGAEALARLSRQLGTSLTTRHQANDYEVVLAMVAQGLGYALLPELAVASSAVPEAVTIARLPGLGTRQITVRHRATRTEPTPATRAVLDLLVAQAGALELG